MLIKKRSRKSSGGEHGWNEWTDIEHSQKRNNEYMNERINQVHEWFKNRIIARMDEWPEWKYEWMNQWMNEWTNDMNKEI